MHHQPVCTLKMAGSQVQGSYSSYPQAVQPNSSQQAGTAQMYSSTPQNVQGAAQEYSPFWQGQQSSGSGDQTAPSVAHNLPYPSQQPQQAAEVGSNLHAPPYTTAGSYAGQQSQLPNAQQQQQQQQWMQYGGTAQYTAPNQEQQQQASFGQSMAPDQRSQEGYGGTPLQYMQPGQPGAQPSATYQVLLPFDIKR